MKRTDLLWIPPDQLIVEDGFNIRYDYGNIDELANSIIENGVKVPLRASKPKGSDKYIITDGHRRFKAVQRAIELGHTDILLPVIPDGKESNEEKRVLGMVVYNDGKRLTLLEEAMVYERLLGFGWQQADIAKKVGKSQTHIANCLILVSAPTSIKELIIEGKISASTIIEQLKEKSVDEVKYDVEKALKKSNGKKVSAKHIKESVNLSVLHTELESIEGLSVSKLDTLYQISLFVSGKIPKEKLIELFKE